MQRKGVMAVSCQKTWSRRMSNVNHIHLEAPVSCPECLVYLLTYMVAKAGTGGGHWQHTQHTVQGSLLLREMKEKVLVGRQKWFIKGRLSFISWESCMSSGCCRDFCSLTNTSFPLLLQWHFSSTGLGFSCLFAWPPQLREGMGPSQDLVFL